MERYNVDFEHEFLDDDDPTQFQFTLKVSTYGESMRSTIVISEPLSASPESWAKFSLAVSEYSDGSLCLNNSNGVVEIVTDGDRTTFRTGHWGNGGGGGGTLTVSLPANVVAPYLVIMVTAVLRAFTKEPETAQ